MTRRAIMAAAIGLAIFWMVKSAMSLSVHDMDAYWNAALRLRSGGPVYEVVADPHRFDVYRYAPWFAVAWMPLTFLPKLAVQVAWCAVLIAASLAVMADLWRSWLGRVLALSLGTSLLWTAAIGNVHPLLVASLYFGVQRRSGPVWIALAGSLKATPILLALVYLGRREWVRAGVAFGLFGLLVAPMALLPNYPNAPGLTLSLWGWLPELYAILAAGAVAITLLLARTSWAWAAGSLAVVLALPRLLLYDFSLLVVGSSPHRRAETAALHRRPALARLRPLS